MHGAIAEVLYLEGPHLGGLTGSRLGALYAQAPDATVGWFFIKKISDAWSPLN